MLLRAAALGGLTAAAWLLSGTQASASQEEPPTVEIAVETPQDVARLLEDPAGWAKAFTAAVIEQHRPAKFVPVPVVTKPREPEPAEEPAEESAEEPAEEPADEGPILDFTGGTQGTTRSGTVSNQAPPEVIKAKAEVRAAKLAAKAAAELPPPPPPPPAPSVVSASRIVPLLPEIPVLSVTKTEPAPVSDLTWTTPGPDAPLPSPQQAPVTATASASSCHTDNSGGTRGVLAVLTSHNSLFPPATWSVEERRDGVSPGSLPGLPSTSPD